MKFEPSQFVEFLTGTVKFEPSQFVEFLAGVVASLIAAVMIVTALIFYRYLQRSLSNNRNTDADQEIRQLERRLEEIQDEERRIIRKIIDAKSTGEAAE